MGPISWRDIVYYARYHGLDEDVTPYFMRIIRRLDETYREFHRKKEETLPEEKTEKRAQRKRQR